MAKTVSSHVIHFDAGDQSEGQKNRAAGETVVLNGPLPISEIKVYTGTVGGEDLVLLDYEGSSNEIAHLDNMPADTTISIPYEGEYWVGGVWVETIPTNGEVWVYLRSA